MLSKIIVLLIMLLSFNAYATTNIPQKPAGTKAIDSALDKMKLEEKKSLEKRDNVLRILFLAELATELGKCNDCAEELPDINSESLNKSADIYMDNLRKREHR